MKWPGKKNNALIGVFVFGIVVSLGIAARPTIASQLYEWQLLPEASKTTELYFTDTSKLPAMYSPNEQQTLAFTVHNMERKSTSYTFRVMGYEASEDKRTMLHSGSFTVEQNQHRNVVVAVRLADFGPKAKLAVELPDQQQSIHYWLTRR